MQRAAHRSHPGGDHGVRIRPDRRGGPRGQRGRGEFVVGQQDQRGRQGAPQRRAGPSVTQPRPQPVRDRIVRARIVRDRTIRDGEGRGEGRAVGAGRRAAGRRGAGSPPAGDDAAPGRDYRRRIQLQPQRVGGRHGGHDDLEPLEQQRPGGQCGLRGPACGQRGGRRPPRRRGLRGRREFAGPEQLGDVLEGTAGGEPDDVEAAVAQPVAGDLGDGRLDRDVGHAGGTPGTAAPGQPLDLLGVEQAAPAIGGAVPAQDAAADVGVERRGLDSEPLGGLGGGQELGHAAITGPAGRRSGMRSPRSVRH